MDAVKSFFGAGSKKEESKKGDNVNLDQVDDKYIEQLWSQIPENMREVQKKFLDMVVQQQVDEQTADLEKEVKGFQTNIDELNQTIYTMQAQLDDMNKLSVNGRSGTAAKSPSKLNTGRMAAKHLQTPGRYGESAQKNSSFIGSEGGPSERYSMGARVADSLKKKVNTAPTRIVNPCKLSAVLKDCHRDGYWQSKSQETLMLFLNDRKDEVEQILINGLSQVNPDLSIDSKEYMIENPKFEQFILTLIALQILENNFKKDKKDWEPNHFKGKNYIKYYLGRCSEAQKVACQKLERKLKNVLV